MREMSIIVRREFQERIRTRAFLYGTALFPVFMGAIFVIPMLGRDGTRTERNIAIVSEPGSAAGFAMAQVLQHLSSDPDYPHDYRVEQVQQPIAEVRQELNERVLAEELDGYVVLPAIRRAGLSPEDLQAAIGAATGGQPAERPPADTVYYRARNIGNTGILRDVRQAATAAVQSERLASTGIAPGELVGLLRGVTLDEAEITTQGEEGRGAGATFFVAYIVAFLVYFMVAFYGVTVMRSVLEEKMNRISEVMVSSVRATDLLMGKILGVSAAAVLQVGIWMLLAAIATGGGAYLPRMLGLPDEIFASFTIELGPALLLLGFFLLGFLLYSSVYAAMGAAMTTEQEAQATQMLVLVPLFVPLLFVAAITSDPNGTLATTLSLIPLCAPIAMPMRLAITPVPASQLALSLALLAVSVVAVAWIGGRIYRIGILSTGRKPTWGELAMWLRGA